MSANVAPNVKQVSPEVAKSLVDNGSTLLDVRTPEEFAAGHCDGAVNVPLKLIQGGDMVPNPEFDAQLAQALPDKPANVVCTCYAGRRGTAAAERLAAAGFLDVHNIVGGMGDWVKADIPVSGQINPPSNN